MNPLVLFDYVYYSIAYFYSSVFDMDYQKQFAGVLLLSLFQLSNWMTLFKFFNLENRIDMGIVSIFISVYAVILVFNFIRYYKFISLNVLEDKWQKDKLYVKLIKNVFTICYIVLSIALLGVAAH